MQQPAEQLPDHLPPDHDWQADRQLLRPCTSEPSRHQTACPSGCQVHHLADNPPLFQETLTYGCVCSDNKQPNISEYTQTLPYHVCTEWGSQCVTKCGSNNDCAADCREKHPCGAQSPTRVNETTTTSTSASATAAPTNQVFNGLSDGSGNSNNNNSGKNAAGALRFGDSYGIAVLAGGLFAGFAMLL